MRIEYIETDKANFVKSIDAIQPTSNAEYVRLRIRNFTKDEEVFTRNIQNDKSPEIWKIQL